MATANDPYADYAEPVVREPRSSIRERESGAEVGQKRASAAKSGAETVTEEQTRPAKVRKAEADAIAAELAADEAAAKAEERKRVLAETEAAKGNIAGDLARTIVAAAAAKKRSKEGWFATGIGSEYAKGVGGTSAADVAGLLDTVRSRAAIESLAELKKAGTVLTPVSNTDIQLLYSSIAALDQAQSDAEFQRSMDVVMERFGKVYKKLGGTPDLLSEAYEMRTGEKLDPGMIPGVELGTPKKAAAPGEKPEPVTELRAGGGESYVSEEAKLVAARLQEAFDKGASIEELNALSTEMTGAPLDPAQIDAAVKFRDAGGQGARIIPAETERSLSSQLIGEVAESPVGAYAINASDALTAGLTDEAIEQFQGPVAAERARFARDYASAENPTASLLGSLSGGIMASIPAVRGAQALLPGVAATRAAVAGEAALGGLTGFGTAEEGEGLQGAALGTLLGAGGAAVPGAVARVAKPRTPGSVRTLREAGVRDMSIGQVMGMPEAEAAVAGVMPGGGDVALRAQRKAFEQFQDAYVNDALKQVGVELPSGLKPTRRMAAAQKTFDDAYQQARANMVVVPDADMWRDIAAFRQKLGSDEFSEQAAARLDKLLKDQIQRRIQGPIGGDEYKSLSSLLGKRRATFAKRQDAEMADGVAELQRIVDNAARRHSPPEVVDFLDRVDMGYSILTRAEEAAKNLGNMPGEFTPQQALGAVRKGDISARNRAYARGEARGQELAEVGVEALGKAPPADVSRIERGLGFTGGVLGGPVTIPINVGLGIANAPGVRQALNTAIAGQRPAAVEDLAELIRRRPEYLAAPAGGAALEGARDRPEDMEELRRRYGLQDLSQLEWVY
jgi:hypothetical protein